MRRVLTAAVLVAGAALTAGAADDEKYTSKDGKFAVAFPAGAKVKLDKKAAGGGLDMKLFTVESKDKAFIVMYMDLPPAAKDVPAKQILDGAEAGSLKQSGSKLVESKDIAFGKAKHPGREILADKGGNKIRTQVIVAEARIYVVAVGGPKDFATGKEGSAFLKSFEITK